MLFCTLLGRLIDQGSTVILYLLLCVFLQVVRSRVESLQSQLSQAQAQIAQVQETNERLSTKNAVLAGENADLLQQVQEGEMAERDLGQVLQVVSDGVRDGNMKVS